jgi:uncharacterized protein YjbJ (UPF0337 family)
MNYSDARSKAGQTRDDIARSGKADKAKGRTKEVIGSARQKVGSLVGSEEMEAKGEMQRADGKKDRLKGEIKEGIQNTKDHIKAGAEVVRDKIAGRK